MLISEKYRELNRELHARNPHYGTDMFGWSAYALNLTENNQYKMVLDYGCGKGKLAERFAANGIQVAEYDPAIEGKDATPEPAELVICTDVLEHIEPEHINAVLRDLKRLTQRRLFVTICTAEAKKTLEDGRNAHLLVKSGEWWREKLLKYFQILIWEEKGNRIAAELNPKVYMGILKQSRPRRTMTPQLFQFFEGMRASINESSDSFSQLHKIALYEGIGDEPADLLGACDSLEHLDDIDFEMKRFASMAKKCAFVGATVDEIRTEWDWKRVLERRLRVTRYERQGNKLLAIGSAMVGVQGVKAIGAMAEDNRREQMLASIKRFPLRIQPTAAHERVAILACYGPSLKTTMDLLSREAAEDSADVITVSGSHDFLVSNGIVPRYHVECDPRPHKADNIEEFRYDVEYLIASVVNQKYFDKMGEGKNIRLWHVCDNDYLLTLINKIGEDPKCIISGGGSVGLRAIPLLYAMGYRKLRIFGMDCSFTDDGEKWAGKHAGKIEDRTTIDCNGRLFVTSPVLMTYATGFFETMQKAGDLDVRLYGDGLLQSMCRYYMGEPAAASAMKHIETHQEGPAA